MSEQQIFCSIKTKQGNLWTKLKPVLFKLSSEIQQIHCYMSFQESRIEPAYLHWSSTGWKYPYPRKLSHRHLHNTMCVTILLLWLEYTNGQKFYHKEVWGNCTCDRLNAKPFGIFISHCCKDFGLQEIGNTV